MLHNQQLLEEGLKKLKEIDGSQADKVMDALSDIAPDLGKYIISFAFGEIYNRPRLDLQQRELITLSALASQGGCEKQLHVHIHASLNVGLSRKQIVETFIQCIPYLGFPKVLNAVFVAKEVFSERDGTENFEKTDRTFK
ncbi:carboxymuconolactone decarboxylase family protein [Basfia succiniciproducens]|uniref:4-carboxymuconolactone decarboxylase n=1 Tax=Basfia succiniciproducens TaxID=653940 RepID=A0A1G5B1P0_9PAST|nr:carboxymuconolactone decarboxylase family protein [Basfia succiniciproducens]QIM69591.1 carboxymuconolactone decarboxylase [Basfia succiniciproducens]SCX83990.1 4-carboxymuconolactone decarboxylase [Basfia succiniciproducens]